MAASSNGRRRSYFERDSHGHMRTVVEGTRHRRNSWSNPNTNTNTVDISDRDFETMSENSSLRTQLSLAQEQVWNLQRNEAAWRQRVMEKEVEINRLLDKLDDEKRRVDKLEDKLEDKLKMMKRGSHGGGSGHELREEMRRWRDEAEAKGREVEILRRRVDERDATIRLGEERLVAKNRKIVYLKDFLWSKGYRAD